MTMDSIMSFIFPCDAGHPFLAAKLEAGTNAKSRPGGHCYAVNLSYCPLSPPLKCLKIGKTDLPMNLKGDKGRDKKQLKLQIIWQTIVTALTAS